MRGKHKAKGLYYLLLGITPADAGKTASSSASVSTAEDHPRGCGENKDENGINCAVGGSPPRMRGKPSGAVTNEHKHRITPADAGKT